MDPYEYSSGFEKKVYSQRDCKVEKRKPLLMTSLENIREDSQENLEKTHKIPELDLFKSFHPPKEEVDRRSTEEDNNENNANFD